MKNKLPLTERQLEILSHLIIMGLTNLETGKRLFITEKTVKDHCTKIYLKLDAKSKYEVSSRYLLRQLPDYVMNFLDQEKQRVLYGERNRPIGLPIGEQNQLYESEALSE